LERTSIGNLYLKDSMTIEDFEKKLQEI
jgi:hypothetical protein